MDKNENIPDLEDKKNSNRRDKIMTASNVQVREAAKKILKRHYKSFEQLSKN